MSETDGIEARIRYWFNTPYREYKIVVEGEVIGHVWSDGTWTLDSEHMTAPQDQRSSMSET